MVAVTLCAQGWSATTPTRQSKQRAERNLLNATRLLKRWHVGLVDPKSGLLRQNTTAVCTGEGKPVARAYPRFACVLKHEKIVVRVAYTALSHNGFEVHRLSRS
jgi:hypothetical protein